MKYSEAEKQIKALSSEYDINMEDGDFNVVYNGNTGIIYVEEDYEYVLHTGSVGKFSVMPFSSKLYMILAELAATPLDERMEEKKHYAKVYDSAIGYLNINNFTGKISVGDKSEGTVYKTKFTNKDIGELKQRDDIPLDWNKVTLEEIEDES